MDRNIGTALVTEQGGSIPTWYVQMTVEQLELGERAYAALLHPNA
jgi:hypothetical protein